MAKEDIPGAFAVRKGDHDFLNFLKDPEESLREFACALDFLNVLDFCD